VEKNNSEHKANEVVAWFSEWSSNFWLITVGVLILLAIIFIYFTVYYFHLYSFDEKTDGLAVFVGLLTLVAAAITLWVSWLIKEEAKSIGDSIITNSVIHRHLDRMLHEYSIVIDRALDSLQTKFGLEERQLIYKISGEQMMILKLSLSAECWRWFHHFQVSDKVSKNFFSYLMPGDIGRKFSSEIGFGKLIYNIKKIAPFQEDTIQKVEKIKKEIKDQYDLLELIYDANHCLCRTGIEESAYYDAQNDVLLEQGIDPQYDYEMRCGEYEANEAQKHEDPVEPPPNEDYINLDNALKKIEKKEVELENKSNGLLRDSYSQQKASPDNDVRYTPTGIELAEKEKRVKCAIESFNDNNTYANTVEAGIAILNLMKSLGWKTDDYALEYFLQDQYAVTLGQPGVPSPTNRAIRPA
jgi:hypothetical protein